MSGFKLAIDGPAGSGKSTISSQIAKKLNWIHIDTGAMYRAVTLKAIELGVDLEDEKAYQFLESVKVHYQANKIYLDDRDVTEDIRSDAVTQNVSLVSSFPYVRQKLVQLQKQAALEGNIVMDGRDIGTVVIPHADVKIFLTATLEERAKRRQKENAQKGKTSQLEKVIKDLSVRDQKDSTRKESPLIMAEDAIIIDTSYLTIEEVVDKIIEVTRKKERNHGD
ncbi:MAG: (d)CMP kinase [Acholeplasmataceae bacterium]|nr:(d)CMP kinase [Acholeplasmataceae bacterium]